MAYEVKKFDYLVGTQGFSDQLLKNHFTLYQGYVANTNKLLDTLATMAKEGKTTTLEFAELKRRLGWEFNGMRLHELYFANIKKGGTSVDAAMQIKNQIVKQFGSYEQWEKEFKVIGAMRGIGWVILYLDVMTGTLCNVWINEHDVGHLSGAIPLLVMDVFEHAFMLDYGLKRADYVEAFFKAIDWVAVEKRMATPMYV